MEETMNIVIGASREYSLYAPVLLLSLFENNRRHTFTVYYYYNEDIEDILINLEKICSDFGNKLVAIFVSDERLKGTDEHGTWHNSTWYRYLFLNDLKGKCDRVLLMGTDIVVTKDITSFYYQNLEDKCIAAVQDSVNMYEWYILYDECIERNKDIKDYVNADVILFAKNGCDGVYDKDPNQFKDAKRYDVITYDDIIKSNLQVIDIAAAKICMENNIKGLVFDMAAEDAIKNSCNDDISGTLIK